MEGKGLLLDLSHDSPTRYLSFSTAGYSMSRKNNPLNLELMESNM